MSSPFWNAPLALAGFRPTQVRTLLTWLLDHPQTWFPSHCSSLPLPPLPIANKVTHSQSAQRYLLSSTRPIVATATGCTRNCSIPPCGWLLAKASRPYSHTLTASYSTDYNYHLSPSWTSVHRLWSTPSKKRPIGWYLSFSLSGSRLPPFSMPSYGSLHSPSLQKHRIMDSQRGRFSMTHIVGDPFALATISISLVC